MFPRLRTAGPQLYLLDGMQRHGCFYCVIYGHARRFSRPAPSARRVSATSASSSTAATKHPSSVPETPACDWTPGADYYFSEEEEKRFLTPSAAVESNAVGKTPRSVGRGGGDAGNSAVLANSTDGADAEEGKTSTKVTIKGMLRTFVIDTAVPPLRREEVERWRLESYTFMKGIAVRRRVEQQREANLLPMDAMVTYLGDDMHKLDKMYRQSGMYTASEVAEAFFPYVPTFPVDSRAVMQALPQSLVRRIYQQWGPAQFSIVAFARYPMLFKYTYSRYSRSTIQLNSNYWFVRQHPSYGKADHAMRKERLHKPTGVPDLDAATLPSGSQTTPLALAPMETDGSGSVAGTAVTPRSGSAAAGRFEERIPVFVQIFHALVRHLPRFPTPPSDTADGAAATFAATKTRPYVRNRYAPFNLMKWINSFPPEDAKLLSSVPEQTVLRVLCQYVNVFQLVSLTESDPNVFVDGAVLRVAREQRAAATDSVVRERCSTRDGDEMDEDEHDGDVTSAEGWDSDDQLSKPAVVEAMPTQMMTTKTTDGNRFGTSAVSAAELAERSARFQQAIKDDLIDVEGILTGAHTDATAVEAAAALRSPAEESGGPAGGARADNNTTFTDDDNRPCSLGDDEDGGEGEDARFDARGEEEDSRGAGFSNHKHRGAEGYEGSSFAPRGFRAPLPQGASLDDITVFGLPLEDIYVRRLPPDVAPRSLSDWDETTSPDAELAALAARFLAPPPSVARGCSYENFFSKAASQYNPGAPPLRIWRWVSVERVYHGYTVEQRHYLRREYKGLVNFLRYHGKLFQMSADLLYVIAHDPEGQLAPIPFMERRFNTGERVVLPRSFDDNEEQSASQVGENERVMFSRNIGEGHVPTCRRHLLVLDPNNPIVFPEVLHEEIANLLPNYPVRVSQVMRRLPPVMRAALPHKANFRASKFLDYFTERGTVMLRRRSDSARPSTLASAATPMSVEDAIAEMLQLPIGPDGVTLRALRYMHLSAPAVDTLCDHYGSLSRAVDAYPQYFQKEVQTIGKRETSVIKFRK